MPDSETKPVSQEGLRGQVVKGGAYLAGRQLIGVAIKSGGLLVLVKLLGAVEYGIYVSALALMILVGAALPLGVPTFLIRQESEVRRSDLDLLFTYQLTAGLTVSGTAWLAYFVAPGLLGADSNYLWAVGGLSMAWSLQFLYAPGRVILDRGLRFAERGSIELFKDVLFYTITLILAFKGFGFKSPVIGQILSNLWVCLAMLYRSKYRPRVRIDLKRYSFLISEGKGYAVLAFGSHLFDSLVVLLAAPLLSLEVAGYIGFAQGLANRAAILRVAANDLTIAALSKVQNDWGKLRNAQSDGTLLHAVSTLALVSGLSLVAKFVVPIVFGEKWLPAVGVLAYLCLHQGISIMFDMHVGILMVLNRTVPVTIQKGLQGLITAFFLVTLVPRYGINGYGPSIVIGTVSFVSLELAIRSYFVPLYRNYILIYLAAVPMFAAPFVDAKYRALTVVPVILALFWPPQRARVVTLLKGTVASFRGA